VIAEENESQFSNGFDADTPASQTGVAGVGSRALSYGQRAIEGPAERALRYRITGAQIVLASAAVNAAPNQLIDGLLGSGTYAEWFQLERDTLVERRRANVNLQRIEKSMKEESTNDLYWDMRLLDRIEADYADKLKRIAAGDSVPKDKVEQFHAIYTLALGVVQHDNDALEAAFATELLIGFGSLGFAVLQARANRLLRLLRALEKRLQQAKKERTETIVQGIINLALSNITMVVPHVGIIARGALLVGQWWLDDALGPSTSKAANVGAKSSLIISQLGPALAKTEELGTTVQSVASAGGTVATVVGIGFDVNEVMVGYQNVDKLRGAVQKCQSAYDALIVAIRAKQPLITKFLADYERWLTSIEEIKQQALLIRIELNDAIRAAGYSVRS
jgi:hypothetical protein